MEVSHLSRLDLFGEYDAHCEKEAEGGGWGGRERKREKEGERQRTLGDHHTTPGSVNSRSITKFQQTAIEVDFSKVADPQHIP